MRSISLLLQCVGAVTALSLPNSPIHSPYATTDQVCCFGLEAQPYTETGIRTDPHAQERYCLDMSTSQFLDGDKSLRRAGDRRNSDPKKVVYCSTAKAYASQEDIKVQLVEDKGEQYLALGGNTEFSLQPGPASDCVLDDMQPWTQGNLVEGGDKLSMHRLLLTDQTPSCSSLAEPLVVGDNAEEASTQKGHWIDLRDRKVETGNTTDPTITCTASSSAPSLAVSKVFVGGSNDQVMVQSMNLAAAISPTQSTAFQFHVSTDWVGSSRAKCAVIFRLPFCSELPSGYPCYNFSGMEQEYVSNSGILFYQVQNQPSLMNWRGESLVQVTPGQDSLVGTFDCDNGGDADGDGRMWMWLAKSQNKFLLQYVQPDEDVHVDNIGLWVVACDS